MAIAITDAGFVFKPILATCPIIPDNKFKPNKIMHEWTFSAYDLGDVSGGSVTCAIDFSVFDKNHYIVVTYIQKRTGSSLSWQLTTETDRWDNTYFPGHSSTLSLHISSAGYSIIQNEMLSKPLYLGRPRLKDSNPGLCSGYLSTNNDGEEYNIILMGYTLERPLPFSSILQP